MRTIDEFMKDHINELYQNSPYRFEIMSDPTYKPIAPKDLEIYTGFHASAIYSFEKDDAYACGIRANHFVVEEGYSEYADGLWYVVTANHKGIRMSAMFVVGGK